MASREFNLAKLETVIDERLADLDMKWLTFFYPQTRPHDDANEIFQPSEYHTLPLFSDLTHSQPEVIDIWNETFTDFLLDAQEQRLVRPFLMGICIVANLYTEDSRAMIKAGTAQLMELINNETRLPRLDEDYLEDYTDIFITSLMSDEPTTWPELLGFNAGMFWVMGLTKDAKKRFKTPWGSKIIFRNYIRELGLARAKLGSAIQY